MDRRIAEGVVANGPAAAVSAAVAVELALTRAQQHASLNAFTTLDAAFACAAARRADAQEQAAVPLRGLTLAVKDNVHVHGLPNSAGTPALSGFYPPDTSPVVRRLQDLGAVVLGKTGMHELAYGITSDNAGFGAVRNPLNEQRITGGSSGGTAAAVAAGIVSAGIGTDTGGSVRLPAALTGTIGFRPTVGVYASDAVTLISSTRDTLGLMTRNVGDAAWLHGMIVGRVAVTARPVQGLTLGVPHRHFLEMLDPAVDVIFRDFLDRLERAGARLVHADMDDVPELNQSVSFAVCLHETGLLLPAYLERYDIGLTAPELVERIASADVASLVGAAIAGAISDEAYREAKDIGRPALQRAYARYFERHGIDAVVFPTSPITARPIADIAAGVWVGGNRHDTFETYIRNTDPASNAGIPAISIPIGRAADGSAIGAEIECPANRDDTLLGIAMGIETAIGVGNNR